MIDHLFQAILPSIAHVHLIGYWVGFFAAFVETVLVVGLLVPGSSLLLLLGAFSVTGHLDFGDLLWFAIAGAVLGDNLNFWLGRRYGQQWIRNGVWLLKPEHFAQVRRFFDDHGAKSVFLGRFIPSIKEIAPFVAGAVGMRRHTFFLWNVLGGIGWGLQWVGGGYLFGQSLNLARVWMSRAGMALVVVLLFWLLLWLVQRAVLRHGREFMLLFVSLARSIAAAIRSNPFVRRLLRRYPGTVAFLKARTDRSRFSGLPLTLLVMAFVYVLALFAGIVEDLVTSDPIIAVDHATAQLVAAFRAPGVITPFLWITGLGVSLVVGPLLAITGLILWLLRRQWLLLPLLASSLGATAFSALGKLAFHRPRPAEAVLLESSSSFPSGHATIAVAFYGFVGYLLIRSARQWKTRVNLFFLTCILILLIGLSRIVLGVHYLSDVWAGYLVGTLWLIIGISMSEWLTAKGRIDWHSRVGPGRRRLALGLGIGALAWYLAFVGNWHPPRKVPEPVRPIEITGPINTYLQDHHIASTESLLGAPGQPLSFALLAKDSDALLSSLREAGWHVADKADLRHMLRLVQEGMAYTTAPLAPAFWNGHINTFALERPVQRGDSTGIVTIRLWRTPLRWAGSRVYVGIAREYVGMQWGLLHRISPDVDAAAGLLVASLQHGGKRRSCRLPLVRPMIGSSLMGGRFFTRGDMWLVDLTYDADRVLPCNAPAPTP